MTIATPPGSVCRRNNANSRMGQISFNQALSINLIVMALRTWQMFGCSVSLSGLIYYSASLALCLTIGYLYLGGKLAQRLDRLQSGIKLVGIKASLGLMILCVMLLDWLTLPAQAQAGGTAGGTSSGFFFTNIQTKLTGIFASSPNASVITPILTFGFGVLQLLFIMFIAWQVAKVIQASRDEEDWLQVAKLPVIVAAGVVGGDFAIGLV